MYRRFYLQKSDLAAFLVAIEFFTIRDVTAAFFGGVRTTSQDAGSWDIQIRTTQGWEYARHTNTASSSAGGGSGSYIKDRAGRLRRP